jgi:Uncharacterized protein conserved in bacteria
MTNRAPDASKAVSASRKIVWLGVAVAAAMAAWTGLWFYGASRIEAYLPVAFAASGRNGAEPTCENAEIRGYPFRVGLFCERAGLALTAEGMRASAGGFRSAAQIYNPRHLVSELDGPLTLTGTNGLAGKFDWQLLHASTVVATDGLSRGSIEGRNVTVDLDGPDLVTKISAEADRVAIHLRRNEADLDMAADGEGLSSPLLPATKTFTFQATVPGGAPLLTATGARDADLRGRTIVLHDLSATFAAGGALTLSGTMAVGDDGIVSGDLKLKASDLAALVAALREVAPQAADQVAGVAQVVAALDTEPGDDAITLPVTIRDGRVASGFIPLGEIPPL